MLKTAANMNELYKRAEQGDKTILVEYAPAVLATRLPSKSNCLHALAKKGIVDVAGIDKQALEIRDGEGKSPLHWLSMSKLSKTDMERFPSEGWLWQDKLGNTPAHYIAEERNPLFLNVAPDKVQSIRNYEDWNTPVMILALNDTHFDVKTIVPAILNIQNVLGDTVAHALAFNENRSFLDCPEFSLACANIEGYTPSDIYKIQTGEVTASISDAKRLDNQKVIQLSVLGDPAFMQLPVAKQLIFDENGYPAVVRYIQKTSDISCLDSLYNARDRKGYPIMHHSVHFLKNWNTVPMHAKKVSTQDGWTTAHYIALLAPDMLSRFTRDELRWADKTGLTPAHIAGLRKASILKQLDGELTHKLMDGQGNTPMDYFEAKKEAFPEIFRIFEEKMQWLNHNVANDAIEDVEKYWTGK